MAEWPGGVCVLANKGAQIVKMSVETGCEAWLLHEMQETGRLARARAGLPTGKAMMDISSAFAAHKSGAQRSMPEHAPVSALHEALVQGQFSEALDLCHQFRKTHRTDMAAVYARLLLPVIGILGEDWNEDRISFEQSAFAFSLMHNILEFLSRQPNEAQSERDALCLGHVVVAVAPGDTHDFGARILTEYLALKGWRATFIDGRNTATIAALLQSRRIEALALSVSVDSAFFGIADMIADWRHVSASRHLEIIVGGSAIQPNRDQYGFLQADCIAMNLNEAAEYLLGQLVSGRYERPELS